MITFLSILLRMKNFQTEGVEKIKTYILRSINFFFRKSCRLWEYLLKYGTATQATDDNTIRHTRFACWITEATNTDSEYVILIAFPRRRWLSERSCYIYMYIACLVYSSAVNTPLSKATGLTAALPFTSKWPASLSWQISYLCNYKLFLSLGLTSVCPCARVCPPPKGIHANSPLTT
jgi:hypothetical protein